MKDIHKISHVLISQDLAGEFIAAIFKTISKEKGPGRVKDIWAKSGLSWKSFMDEKKVDDFVKSKVCINIINYINLQLISIL